MANSIYIRRMDKQCITHQIGITIKIQQEIFNGRDTFTVIGEKSGEKEEITIFSQTDKRFSGNIKTAMKKEIDCRGLIRDIQEGDLLTLKAEKGDVFKLGVIISDDGAVYDYMSELCREDRHSVVIAASEKKDLEESGIEVRQLIKYGVPGTGKSYGITEKIKETYSNYDESDEDNDCEFVFRTTLHPEYSYYDFVGTTYPVVKDDKNITYDFKPGIFTLALSKAMDLENGDKKVFLVLEEMSRANVAAVFGDLFQLLDRRDDGRSAYKIRNDLVAEYVKDKTGFEFNNNNIYLPENFYIYGTVNTSDQNVFVMDNAFKRRFEFEYVGTEPVSQKNGDYRNDYKFELGNHILKWTDFYQKLNKYVTKDMKLREDKQIGQFFVKFKEGYNSNVEIDKYNYNQIKNKVLQYIWEDVHKCAMAEKPLFKEEIATFGEAYSRIEKHENVFCEKFYDELTEEAEDDSTELNSDDIQENKDAETSDN
ncbi:AAA family ATPase [Falcatimonas sp. MSJ-15]|uniref:AAA family ATPase n=1 Tax=Falcatimonas sp. MSJ-15 TaxID=2841515 RepID=UPI001C10D45E|nr:AAA family ATPase [Falcatimonas sp. MSJ-15]MBU5470562.1 AAA family ATPase [Falcatimonas sp. MSJ-15]